MRSDRWGDHRHERRRTAKANRKFDLIMTPNRARGLNEPYFIRRRRDYFVQYLMGATPPDNYAITRPVDPAGNPGGGNPDGLAGTTP